MRTLDEDDFGRAEDDDVKAELCRTELDALWFARFNALPARRVGDATTRIGASPSSKPAVASASHSTHAPQTLITYAAVRL